VESIRAVFGIVVGYVVTSLAAMGVVGSLWGAGESPTTKTVIIFLIALAVGSAVGGFLCTLIVGSANHPAIYITIGVMIAMAVFAHATGRAIEPNWYKLVGLMTQAGGFMIGASGAAYRLED
jgi:hypothetical protein